MSDQYPTTPQPGEPGGYTPPPANQPPVDPYAGQAGAYPPPPPPPPYDPTVPGMNAPQPLSVGAALSYSWTKFTQNIGPLVVVVLVAFLAFGILYGIGIALGSAVGGASYSGDSSVGFAFGGVSAVLLYAFLALGYVAMMIISLGLMRATLDITAGRPVSFQSVFNFSDLGGALVTAIVVGLATAIGSMLCYLPGIVIAFFTMYAILFSLDKKMPVMDAVKASFEMVKNNVGPSILILLVAGLIAGVGGAVCGIGALVTYPMAMIMLAYAYRYLQGEPIAE